MTIDSDQHNTPVYPDGTPLQIARWSGQRVAVTTSGSTQRITLPAGTKLIELTAVESLYANFGGSGVNATNTIANDGSRLFLAGVQVIQVPLDSSGVPYTHVAVLQLGTAGIFQVEALD